MALLFSKVGHPDNCYQILEVLNCNGSVLSVECLMQKGRIFSYCYEEQFTNLGFS